MGFTGGGGEQVGGIASQAYNHFLYMFLVVAVDNSCLLCPYMVLDH